MKINDPNSQHRETISWLLRGFIGLGKVSVADVLEDGVIDHREQPAYIERAVQAALHCNTIAAALRDRRVKELTH